MSKQPEKPKKVIIDLALKEKFDCINSYKCIIVDIKNKETTLTICDAAPCVLMAFKFGTHKIILKNFLRNFDFFQANLYFQNLIPIFVIDCNIEQYNKFKDDNAKDAPAGCKLFIDMAKLEKLESELLILQNFDSDDGENIYNNAVETFNETITDNLIRLEHLALDNRKKATDDLREKYYNIAIVNAQMGNLEVENIKTPIHADTIGALNKSDKTDKKEKIPEGL